MNNFFSRLLRIFRNPATTAVDNIPHDADASETAEKKEMLKPKAKPATERFSFWWKHFPECNDNFPEFEAVNNEATLQTLEEEIRTENFTIVEIPDNIMRAIEILNTDDFDYNQVISLVERSPGLATEFLKMVNSAVYSRGGKISDLRLALPRLGRTSTKAVIYLYSARTSLPNKLIFLPVIQSIVRHCQATALIAGYLSRRYYPDPESAFTAGLLHDVGKLALLQNISKTFNLPEEINGELTEESFNEIFPKLHEKVGAFLAELWDMDDEIKAAIGNHHHFMKVDISEENDLGRTLASIIELSDLMARILGFGRTCSETNIFELPAAKAIGIIEEESTYEFLEDIPKLLSLHIQQS